MIDFNPSGGFFGGAVAGRIRKLALLGLLFCGCAAADAKVIYVNGARNKEDGDGTKWSKAYKYLRDALLDSAPNDEIWVTKGTYYPDDTAGLDKEDIFGDREISFEINGQKIYGGFVGTEVNFSERDPVANPTILSGGIWQDSQGNIIRIYSSLHVAKVNADSTLDGLTIANGNANGSLSWTLPRIPVYDRGGGCYVSKDKVLTLQGCTFSSNNASEFGGAIIIEDGLNASTLGKVVATNCNFDQNTIAVTPLGPDSCQGGGVYGNVDAVNCTFSFNGVRARKLANGGAIAGKVITNNCTFTGNTARATAIDSESSGGAISGDVTGKGSTFTANACSAAASYGGAVRGAINAANFVFVGNGGAGGGAVATNGTGTGGGGAIYVEPGTSSLVNSVFLQNTSLVRGGAVVGGPNPESSSLLITNCTFLDNGVNGGGGGAALCVMGIVNILNNIYWNTASIANGFDQDNLISVTKGGFLRNTSENYPVPPEIGPNVVKAGALGIRTFTGGDTYLGNTVDTLIAADPKFVSAADPNGADDLWRTADDGLRLMAGSSAIATTGTVNNRGQVVPFRKFLAKDTLDIDGDGNVTENTPSDIAAYARVQNILVPLPPAEPISKPYLDIGAYEYGDLLNAPDISVEYPAGTILVDGAATIDFTGLSSIATTFVIKNLGGSDLSNLSITGDGVDTADFKLTQPVTKVLTSGSSTTFTITFAPSGVGLRNAAIHIVSNDAEENPFDINLTGTAQLPDIGVEYPAGTPLEDAASTVDYGSVGLSATATKTFTISNTGLGNLSITKISITGADASSFVATAPGSTFLTTGQFTTFDLTYKPSANGIQTAALIIKSTDPDAESSFRIELTAKGVGSPEILVKQPFSAEVVDGETNDFGSVEIGSTYSKKFIIKNTGTATLKNIAIALTGSSTFTTTVLPINKLAPAESETFTVTFKPGSLGGKSGALKITSNDDDEGQIDVSLIGNGISKSSTGKSSGSLASVLAPTVPQQLAGETDEVTFTTTSDGAKYLVLTVGKTAGWNASNHTVEVSSNLVDWFSGAKHTTILVDSETILQVRDNTPVKDGAKRYIRLK